MAPRKKGKKAFPKYDLNANNNEPFGKDGRLSSLNIQVRGSKPMLMIPQPVLRSHGLDTNLRVTRLESNALGSINMALGIKEEPEDIIEFQEPYSQIEADFSFGIEKTNVAGFAQPTKKRRTPKPPASPLEEDANNNRRRTRAMEKKENQLQALSSEPDVQAIQNGLGILENVTSSIQAESADNIIDTRDRQGSSNSPHKSGMPLEPAEAVDHILSEQSRNEKTDIQIQQEIPAEITLNEKNCDPIPETNEKTADALNTLKEKETSLSTHSLSELEELSNHSEMEEGEVNARSDAEDDPFNDSPSESDEKDTSNDEDSEDIFPKMWVLKEEERRTLTCNVCKKIFSRVSILTAHKKKHFDPNIYKCDHCDKVFSSESSYKHHIAYSGLAPFKCDKCGKSYYTEMKCKAHQEQCEGKNTERKYKCEDCGRSYMMLCSLRTHIRERHSDFVPVKNLCCDQCGKRFRHRKYLDLHMYSHSSEKKFECDICHRKYKSSDILRHHVRMVHKNPPKVTCDICDKEVSRVSLKAHLNRHREKQEEEEESARNLLQLATSEDSPYCRVCGKYFENDKLLEMHCCAGRDGEMFPCFHCSEEFQTATDLVKHTCPGQDNSKSRNSSKIYKCLFCCREYNCHTPWLYHVRHHTGDKPYPCSECDKSFRLKQGLKVHMRNHTGEKPFKCDKCPAAFKQKPFLLDHLNTHTGDKPYQCERCLARFSVRSALSTHKRIHRREMKGLH